MRKKRLVVLFGDSLIMDVVEASLSTSPEVGIVRMHTAVTNVAARLEILCPDLVVFDINAPVAQFAIPFLRDRPSIPLIGLDLTCSRVVSLFCEHHTVLTSDDLDHVIRTQIENKPDHQAPSPLPLIHQNQSLAMLCDAPSAL